VMDLGWVVTLASRQRAVPQVSILSEGGSGAPVPDLSIEVDDVDGVHRRAQAMGCRVIHALADEPWGVRRFFIADPCAPPVINARLLGSLMGVCCGKMPEDGVGASLSAPMASIGGSSTRTRYTFRCQMVVTCRSSGPKSANRERHSAATCPFFSAERVRQAAGATPNSRLNARLKAASDS
jgi:hypothetical protein